MTRTIEITSFHDADDFDHSKLSNEDQVRVRIAYGDGTGEEKSVSAYDLVTKDEYKDLGSVEERKKLLEAKSGLSSAKYFGQVRVPWCHDSTSNGFSNDDLVRVETPKIPLKEFKVSDFLAETTPYDFLGDSSERKNFLEESCVEKAEYLDGIKDIKSHYDGNKSLSPQERGKIIRMIGAVAYREREAIDLLFSILSSDSDKKIRFTAIGVLLITAVKLRGDTSNPQWAFLISKAYKVMREKGIDLELKERMAGIIYNADVELRHYKNNTILSALLELRIQAFEKTPEDNYRRECLVWISLRLASRADSDPHKKRLIDFAKQGIEKQDQNQAFYQQILSIVNNIDRYHDGSHRISRTHPEVEKVFIEAMK